MTNSIAQVAVAVERVQAIIFADQLIPEAPNATEPALFKGKIVFEGVAFAYKPDAPVLKEVSFTIEPGQVVGFVGATGGGKSTVASLIPRFYDPTAGRILVDGVDAREYRLASLRSQVGIVLQDTVLFQGTIADNIAYGRPGATRLAERQEDAAEKLALADRSGKKTKKKARG
ncbi:MAG TPA: ATP-binding cassette domain-containing protein [Gemmatimonadales bacterium]|nr:ATP-binding cassette domain-containing protein [Gemmatimonadales bacterium]